MTFYKSIFSLAIFLSAFACGVRQKNNGTSDKKEIDILVLDHKNATKADSLATFPIANKKGNESIVEEVSSISDTTFVNLKDLSSAFVYDIRYATALNFMRTPVYDCDGCFLRLKTAKALIRANEKFIKKGYRIVIFDCYRPLSVQKKMWEIIPNPIYVADPKKGSIHNRGGAVDIGLVDLDGNRLDMGTDFDHFGIEASHDYENLPDQIKQNRRLLKKVMTQSEFRIFDSEWWHYNLKNAQKFPVSNFKWQCD